MALILDFEKRDGSQSEILSMKLNSWDRFRIKSFAVVPELMGQSISFERDGSSVTLKLPSMEQASDRHDERASAYPGAWWATTNEPIYFVVQFVDVCVSVAVDVNLPLTILDRPPNAFDLLSEGQKGSLNAIVAKHKEKAESAFHYLVSLLRWVSGFHAIGRHGRIGNSSGWSTRLYDRDTNKDVWVATHWMEVTGYREITKDNLERVRNLASTQQDAPIYVVLYDDAMDCLDVKDYRRALVDLCVACEVFLRNRVISALPKETTARVSRLIEEANINQFVTHLFPELLSEALKLEYKKNIKGELSALFDKRNKLMHVAKFDEATLVNCQRFAKTAQELFNLLPD